MNDKFIMKDLLFKKVEKLILNYNTTVETTDKKISNSTCRDVCSGMACYSGGGCYDGCDDGCIDGCISTDK